MCGINLIAIAIAAIILTAAWYIVQAIPFFAPFKTILQIVFAAVTAIMILTQVVAPLLACA